MQTIENMSNDARQKHTVLLAEDSSRIVLKLTYKPTQMGWFLDLSYENLDFNLYGLRITTNTNLLNQWRNVLPFGIMCTCDGNQDPLLLDDFIVNRAQLHILSKEEVAEIVKEQEAAR